MSSLKELLGNALDAGRLAHAYLLVGEGAAPIVEEFLLRLYCERACRGCPSCLKVLHKTHPDVQQIEPSGRRIGIDQIRRLQQDARYRPLEAPRKVYIIEGAEDLSPEAANSLLKILESPPHYVIFLLTAYGLRLPPTILSRCQIVRLPPPSRSHIERELQARGFSENEIEYLAVISQGFPQRLARLISESAESLRPLERREEALRRIADLDDARIIAFFSQAEGVIEERESALELLRRLRERRPHELLQMAGALSKLSTHKLELFLLEALRWKRDLLLIGTEDELIFNRDRRDELMEERTRSNGGKITRALDALRSAREALQGNANVQLLLESLLFKISGSK